MKPVGWDSQSQVAKEGYAREFIQSMRGAFIMGQALVVAIEQLRKAKRPETSNIQDMEVLLELFPLYAAVTEMQARGRHEEKA